MRHSVRRLAKLAALVACHLSLAPLAQADTPSPRNLPAVRLPQAMNAPLQAGVCAGTRQVAVGDHGVILLSDDAGEHWRQARQVPTDVVLTSVSFADSLHGWSAGQWGTILATEDGGETWTLQRQDTLHDRPLFAIHFFDGREGLAVGLWSLVLLTHDGGQHWETGTTGLPKAGGQTDLNLYALFTDTRGLVYATSEHGQVLRSTDRGRHWAVLDTHHAGSLWTGGVLPQGRILVAGLRGAIRYSDDDGQSWNSSLTQTTDSIHDLAIDADGAVLAVGANGAMLRSADGGAHFETTRLPDRLPLTAALRCTANAPPWTALGAQGPLKLQR